MIYPSISKTRYDDRKFKEYLNPIGLRDIFTGELRTFEPISEREAELSENYK